jgi:hypothetical protein
MSIFRLLLACLILIMSMQSLAHASDCPEGVSPAYCALAKKAGTEVIKGGSPEEIQKQFQSTVSQIQKMKAEAHAAKIVTPADDASNSMFGFLKNKGDFIPLGILLVVLIAYFIDTHKLLFVGLFTLLNVSPPLVQALKSWLEGQGGSAAVHQVSFLGSLGWKGMAAILVISAIVSAFTRSILLLGLVAGGIYAYTHYAMGAAG